MFKKLVVMDPVSFHEQAKNKLHDYAENVVFYDTFAEDNKEKIQRIGDADAVLVSYRGTIDGEVIEACPNIKYIGMCCSLYSVKSANVDILTAEKKGITVWGISDYGDNGVIEFIVSDLIQILHGFGDKQWKAVPTELTDLNVGIVGMGNIGKKVAKALSFFGAKVHYFDLVRKPELEDLGYIYLPLEDMLKEIDVLMTFLNKNVKILFEKEFALLGSGTILLNTAISPSYDIDALKNWLSDKSNYYICDSDMALGERGEELLALPNVVCAGKASGSTAQEEIRFCEKILENLEKFLTQNPN